jgi:hypothetical protein
MEEPAAAPAAPAEGPAPGDFVEVRMPPGKDVFGQGTYYGILSAETTDETIVLDVPQAGKIKIKRPAGVEISKTDAMIHGFGPPPQAEGERSIRTTHLVYLKNGRKIAGNLVPTPETEPVRLDIGQMGRIMIRRTDILPDGIKELRGAIDLPEEPAPTAPEAAPSRPSVPPELREEMKRELKAEILRELLDQIIDDKMDEAVEEDFLLRLEGEPGAGLDADRVAAIEEAVRDLTRHRTTYRTRSERRLREMGSAVLPYLEGIVEHPFELTRRAVMRIVRDIGARQGAPLAICGLTDADYHVRELAGEALKAILPSPIVYSPSMSEEGRLEVQARYASLYDQGVRARLRDAIVARIGE